ncbi:hypothetical protein AURDEDRAFT_114763 [Auricularia subglabra TFB-10046 SS5]|nr:hypothetical protein AURDEDRAFT_114763 [Auricularia subglabra TFB-10046 SS5]
MPGTDSDGDISMTHSSSLVDPDDSFVIDHNNPRAMDMVGIIGSGKGAERPGSVATARQDDSPSVPSSVTHGPTLPGLVSPPRNEDEERQVKSYASALELLASACCRVLNLAEQRTLKPLLPNFAYPVPILSPSDLSSLIANNPAIAASYLSCIIAGSSAPTIEPATDPAQWLAVTTRLPPTLASFDFFGRMLRDESPIVEPAPDSPLASRFMSLGSVSSIASATNGGVNLLPAGLLSPGPAPPPSTSRAAAAAAALGANTSAAHGLGFGSTGQPGRVQSVSDVVRDEALGAFVSGCIAWIENAEQDEREGLVADDRVLRGIQGLCRFFSSLLKLRLVDPRSDAQTAEMVSFALAHSRFEDALGVYRMLASARSG